MEDIMNPNDQLRDMAGQADRILADFRGTFKADAWPDLPPGHTGHLVELVALEAHLVNLAELVARARAMCRLVNWNASAYLVWDAAADTSTPGGAK